MPFFVGIVWYCIRMTSKKKEPAARGLREAVEARVAEFDRAAEMAFPDDPHDSYRRMAYQNAAAALRADLAEHTPEATEGEQEHVWRVVGRCPKPWCAYPMPHDHTDGSGPTFDTLLSDPTQQLDGEGVVLASVLAHQAEPRRLTTAEREWLDDSMMHGFDALVHTVQRLMARAADEVCHTLAEPAEPDAGDTEGMDGFSEISGDAVVRLHRSYAHRTFAEVLDDYVLVRGDLTAAYAREQLVREHEARLAATADQARREPLATCGLDHGGEDNAARVYGHYGSVRTCIRLKATNEWAYDPAWETTS